MVHPDVTPRRSQIHGIGMIALRPLTAGTIVWAPCKRCAVWSSRELAALAENARLWLDEFGYWLDDGSVLLVCGSGYLFNYSCNANVESDGLDFGVLVQDIPEGGELTIDYREFRNELDWTFWCGCGTSAHRVAARSKLDDTSRNYRRGLLDRTLTHEAMQMQALAPQLSSRSKTYRKWLRAGCITYNVGSIFDPCSGLGEPARRAYLTQEMGSARMIGGIDAEARRPP